MKKLLGTVFTFALGAAAGAVVGMLAAPHKGSLTRAKLKHKLEENMERGQERAYDLKHRAKNARNRSGEGAFHRS